MRVTFIPHSYSISLVIQKKDWVKKSKGVLKDEIDQEGGVAEAHSKFEQEWDEKKS